MDFKLFGYDVFSIEGRMNREPYIKMAILSYFVPTVLFWLCWVLLGGSFLGRLVSLILTVLIFITHMSFAVRRLHDLGKSGLWYIVIVVPLLSVILVLLLIFIKGNAGANQYGADPLAVK